MWIGASALFALYVSNNFGSYNKTYGALGGAVTFLVWLWITNIAVLLGAELNAELERSREIEVGVPGGGGGAAAAAAAVGEPGGRTRPLSRLDPVMAGKPRTAGADDGSRGDARARGSRQDPVLLAARHDATSDR